jgi:hypothetical protein
MQAVVTWLVARPLNAVLALAATSSPYLGFLSSILMVLFVLSQGVRTAVLQAVMAAVLLAGVALLVGTPVTLVISVAIMFWLPAVLLAKVLTATRSLTLSMQVLVLVAVAGMLGFFVLVGDPTTFWEAELQSAAEVWRSLGAVELADQLTEGGAILAAQMTMLIVIMFWTMYAATFALGYNLYRQLPGETADYGRFRDLNFGRVIALIMALCSLVAWFSGAVWLQNIAFVMFAVFWLQGLAIVHWMHAEKALPTFAVVVVYLLMLPLSAAVIIALAVLGYIDAWFGLRRKTPAA